MHIYEECYLICLVPSLFKALSSQTHKKIRYERIIALPNFVFIKGIW